MKMVDCLKVRKIFYSFHFFISVAVCQLIALMHVVILVYCIYYFAAVYVLPVNKGDHYLMMMVMMMITMMMVNYI